MKSLVAVKRVIDYNVKDPRQGGQDRGRDPRRARHKINARFGG
jgi:hypothetical protein